MPRQSAPNVCARARDRAAGAVLPGKVKAIAEEDDRKRSGIRKWQTAPVQSVPAMRPTMGREAQARGRHGRVLKGAVRGGEGPGNAPSGSGRCPASGRRTASPQARCPGRTGAQASVAPVQRPGNPGVIPAGPAEGEARFPPPDKPPDRARWSMGPRTAPGSARCRRVVLPKPPLLQGQRSPIFRDQRGSTNGRTRAPLPAGTGGTRGPEGRALRSRSGRGRHNIATDGQDGYPRHGGPIPSARMSRGTCRACVPAM
jgi:hypothetical protein